MRIFLSGLAAAALATSVPALPQLQSARAACTCECVNGQVRAVCSSSIDLKPICPARICPISPPAVRPVAPLSLPPLGTKSCRMEQVYNDAAGEYQWERICR